ncbi:MAG: Hint domain-containing protein [Planctomycetes bacterium]|nr:Hint domain-containing protein [Planctomycetota bacterium]
MVRVRVNMAPPPAGAPIIAGGFGYWRYEVRMTAGGQVVSTARQRTGFCVARGTSVETPSGPKPIEQIREGDLVWGYDLAKNKPVVAKVTATIVSAANETLRFGDLRVTGNHPVYANGQWTDAVNLSEKDKLLGKDLHWREVGVIRVIAGKVDVFDLTVDGAHNFFAGGVLVHNKSIAWTPQHFVPWYALWNQAPPRKKQP